MGVAGLIFEPHPPNSENQYNFWRFSIDAKMIFWFLYRFQIIVECSVQICSCPCLKLESSGFFHVQTTDLFQLDIYPTIPPPSRLFWNYVQLFNENVIRCQHRRFDFFHIMTKIKSDATFVWSDIVDLLCRHQEWDKLLCYVAIFYLFLSRFIRPQGQYTTYVVKVFLKLYLSGRLLSF